MQAGSDEEGSSHHWIVMGFEHALPYRLLDATIGCQTMGIRLLRTRRSVVLDGHPY